MEYLIWDMREYARVITPWKFVLSSHERQRLICVPTLLCRNKVGRTARVRRGIIATDPKGFLP